MNLSKLAATQLKSVATEELTTLGALWADQPTVVTFLRRFGWVFCRLGAKDLSAIHPQLKEHGVRLVGVGLEELGKEEFVAGQFFSGDLFIDAKQESYKEMKMKRHGYMSILPGVFGKKGRSELSRAKGMGIEGNLKGDGFLMGGTIVVSAGGKELLLEFKQDGPADHVENSAVLKALGISESAAGASGPAATAGGGADSGMTCVEDVCSR